MKIFVNSYFSDFEPFFLLFGGVCAKCPFYKKEFFLREDFFETNLDLRKHPPTGFLDLFLIFQIFVFHICIYLGNWGVEGAICNILELLDQNPWRNNLLKLGTFDSILQRPHSAMTEAVS